MSRNRKAIKRTNNKKIAAIALLMSMVVLFVFWNDTTPSEAAWQVGETNSDQYEVLELSDKNDSSTVEKPMFSIESYKCSSNPNNQDKVLIDETQTTITGVGKFQKGDTFKVKAYAEDGRNFKSQNIKFSSTDTAVLKVSANGQCTVVGPGVASVQWTYTYQRFYDEEILATTGTGTTDENGVELTEQVKTVVRYVDSTSTITGELSTTIYPQILNNSVYMMPNDTMYLKTNVPGTNTTFSADYEQAQSSVKSLEKKVIDGYWWVLITSKDANDASVFGSIYVKVSIQDDDIALTSDAAEVVVTNDFGMTPSYASFNCVKYNKNANGKYVVEDNTQTISVATSTTSTPITWVYISEDGEMKEIPAGSNATTLQSGMTARITGTSLVLTTDETFFDKVDESTSYIDFTIRATQTFPNDSTFQSESNVRVTRPVKSIEIQQAGTGNVLNSRQEVYTQIGYETNGNGLTVPVNKFGNDTDILTAWLAGLGDVEKPAIGTNGNTVTSYEYMHTPYNSGVKWVSTDENVIQIQTVTSGNGYSNCNVVAVGAGKATVQAFSEDGSFVSSVEYIVRPYPQNVTMKDTLLTERLGELTSKQVTLIAYVSSGDETADQYIDDGLNWEISSITNANGNDIATVDQNGVVTFTGPGTIVVKATSSVDHNGFNAYRPYAVCTITIEQPVEKVNIINKPTEPIMTGDILALKTKIEPTNATDQSVVWSSANTSIVTVDENGKVTAVGPGSTTVRVQTNSGAKYDTCTIEVRRLASSVSLNRSEAQVSRGKKLQLLATVLPEDTTDKTITWTSSNKNIATVSDKGVVTGVKVSKDPVIITATTSNGKSAECYITVTEPVTGIKISPKKKTIYVGNTFTIKTTLYPLANDSINKNVTFRTSDKAVATVDANGKVTPKAGGKCTIYCTSVDGGYIAKCVVTVKEKVSSIKLNRSKLQLAVNSKYQLKATVRRTTATNRAVTWKSSNVKVATVDQTGKIITKKTGTAKITCTAKDKSGVSATCKVTVVRKVTGLKLNKSYITLIAGYQYRTLKATVTPSTATKKSLVWTSTDSSIVSVKRTTGTMFAEKAGTAYIKVRTTDGTNLSRMCRVKVIDPVPIDSLTISQSQITLVNGQKSQLEARAIPTNTTSGIRWMTDDRTIATVSSTGLVTAKGPGKTTITAYTNEGVESQCTVEVIKMNPQTIAIEQYDKYLLAVDGAESGGEITWNSSNSNVVTVTTEGEIMGVKPGSATIFASYNGKKVSCRVTVKQIP